ncbi:unnamed protein product [Effrenium voratum]|nr:unnamed protein product [Effrenium voratum]
MAARTEEAKLVQIKGTEFLVDGFLFQRKEVKHYVLTHFHSDHTVGLTRKFDAGTIYCTDVTAALITNVMGVDAARVVAMTLQETLQVDGVSLTLLDAGHCPGSSMAAFEDPDAEEKAVILHTGDCRACSATRENLSRWLGERRVTELFLDTTYCTPRWRFPPQSVACDWLREITRRWEIGGRSCSGSHARSLWWVATRSARSGPRRRWRRRQTVRCSWSRGGGRCCSWQVGATRGYQVASPCGASTRRAAAFGWVGWVAWRTTC